MESLYQQERQQLPLRCFAWRHKRKIVTVALAGIALTLVYLSLVPRRYQSHAKLLVRIGWENVTLDPTATTGEFLAIAESRESGVHAVEELITSRFLAEKIVDQFAPAVILEKSSGGGALSDRLAWLNDFNLNPLRVYSLRDKAVKALQENLGIRTGKKSNVVSVSYIAKDPQLAREVLDALLKAAQEDHVRVHRTRGSQQFFQSQRALLQADLLEKEQQLCRFKDEHNLVSLSTQRDTQVALIGSLQADFLRAKAEQSAVQAELDLRRRQLRDQPALIVTEQTMDQPQTAKQTLREKLYDLEVKEQELAALFKDNSPQLVQIRTQIAEARRIANQEKATTETKRGVSQTHQAAELALQEREAQLIALAARTESLEGKISAATAELKKLNAGELELTRMERELELTRASYRKYSENLEQARIDQEIEEAKISSLSLMQPPTWSETPVSPQPLATLALGGVLSIVASLGVALLAERRLAARPAELRATPVVPELSSPPVRVPSRPGEMVPATSG
jgi:uncharacterized protein involved in exopolysaccharide biosynthesis